MTDTLEPLAPPSVEALTECVLACRATMAGASGTDWSRLDSDGVGDLLDAVEELSRILPAVVGGALVREVADRGLDVEAGCRSTVSYLQHKLRLSRGEAAARVQAAERFQPRTQLTGEILPPRYPKVAAAMQSGELSAQHGKVIADSLQRLPTAVSTETREAAEEHLVDCAREWGPTQVGRLAQHLEEVLDPDGLLTTEREREQRRELTVHKTAHGMYRLHGLFEKEAANAIETALGPLTTPTPGENGEPDPRPAGKRRADALVEIATWAMDQPGMPRHGGRAPQIVATMTLADLRRQAGVATLNNGEPVPIPRLLEKAGAVDAVLAVFGSRGQILYYGREQRLAPGTLRKALETRDRGCAFASCDAPALWTQAHHVKAWADGGRTDVTNLALLCTFHHTLVHKASGWQLWMINGVPHTIPPPWVDKTQRPRRNRTHDPPDTPGP